MKPKRKTQEQMLMDNPIAASIFRKQIADSIKQIKDSAELQAFMGDAADKLIADAGQLLFAVAYAAAACRLPDGPDIRILRGTGEALADLARNHGDLERQRQSIISGLAAIERLLPTLSPWALGLGLIECRQRLSQDGFGTQDIHALLTPGATIGKPVTA
jgi:hypothetical protein